MNWEAIILSMLGGSIGQLLNLAEIYKIEKSKRPDFKDFTYWLPYIIYPIISGVIAYAYFDDKPDVNKMLAIQIGASAPLIFKSLATAIPSQVTSSVKNTE